jgi:hypothetical protein
MRIFLGWVKVRTTKSQVFEAQGGMCRGNTFFQSRSLLFSLKSQRLSPSLVTGFTGILQLITTINYNITTNSNTLKFITASIKSFQSAVSSLAVTW